MEKLKKNGESELNRNRALVDQLVKMTDNTTTLSR